MASSGHSKCIPDLVRPVTTSTPTRIFWTDRLRCFLMYYSIPRRTMNEIDLKDLLKKENHDRKIKVNQRTQYFFFLQFIKKLQLLQSWKCPYWLLQEHLQFCAFLHADLQSTGCLQNSIWYTVDIFFSLLENRSTALASKHFKDQQKTWEFIFCAGPIRVTLKLPESFHSLT